MSLLEPESGIWYALCWLVLLTRLFSRRIHRGAWKHLQLDDVLIVLSMASATVLMAVMHIVVHTSSNLIAPDEDYHRFSKQEVESRIYGSKLVLVVEQMQLTTIWLVKACLLLMYNRMTLLLPQHKIVLLAALYVGIGFVVMEILYFAVWCRPFHEYWAVPTSSPQCSAATNHLITNAVLNISSDLIIISIPIPLLFKVKLPMKNKLILSGIFLIGTFTIIAAVLNKYYSFTHPFGTEWTIWYLRESYTAILCANLPLTYPLIQRMFKLSNWSHNSYSGHYPSGSHPQRTLRSGLRSQRRSKLLGTVKDRFGGGAGGVGGISKTVEVSISHVGGVGGGGLRRTESEEGINEIGEGSSGRGFEEGSGRSEAWITSAIEMGEMSPGSGGKEGSVSTSGSLKSLERKI